LKGGDVILSILTVSLYLLCLGTLHSQNSENFPPLENPVEIFVAQTDQPIQVDEQLISKINLTHQF